jgi:hypothetical protein
MGLGNGLSESDAVSGELSAHRRKLGQFMMTRSHFYSCSVYFYFSATLLSISIHESTGGLVRSVSKL